MTSAQSFIKQDSVGNTSCVLLSRLLRSELVACSQDEDDDEVPPLVVVGSSTAVS